MLAADVVRVEGQQGLVRRHTRRAAVKKLHHEIELVVDDRQRGIQHVGQCSPRYP